MDFGFTPKLTRIRVLHCEMELILRPDRSLHENLSGMNKKKSNDQRKPFGYAIPVILSLQEKLCLQYPVSDRAVKR